MQQLPVQSYNYHVLYLERFLLSGGTKGKRLALPNAEIMIHQPSGGARGQETEIRIVAENILKTRNKLNEILAANTGKSVEEISRDTEPPGLLI